MEITALLKNSKTITRKETDDGEVIEVDYKQILIEVPVESLSDDAIVFVDRHQNMNVGVTMESTWEATRRRKTAQQTLPMDSPESASVTEESKNEAEPEPDLAEIKAAFTRYRDEDRNEYFVAESERNGAVVYCIFKRPEGGEQALFSHLGRPTAEAAQEALNDMATAEGWSIIEHVATQDASEPDMDVAQIDNALHDALMLKQGANERWAALVRNGADAQDIQSLLLAEWSDSIPSQYTGDIEWYVSPGADNKSPWFSTLIEDDHSKEVHICGEDLIRRVRAILNIPEPKPVLISLLEKGDLIRSTKAIIPGRPRKTIRVKHVSADEVDTDSGKISADLVNTDYELVLTRETLRKGDVFVAADRDHEPITLDRITGSGTVYFRLPTDPKSEFFLSLEALQELYRLIRRGPKPEAKPAKEAAAESVAKSA